jgi:hypothetical protein
MITATLTLHLTVGAPPRVLLNRTSPVSATIYSRVPVLGPLRFVDWIGCHFAGTPGPGPIASITWSGWQATRDHLLHGPSCASGVWRLVAGWLNHRVAIVDFPNTEPFVP